MALIRLLYRKPDGKIVFRDPTVGDVPPYAILSHTWGEEEVSFQAMEADLTQNQTGWRKIDFCARQAEADGLRYFWVDTCCIDKKNNVELAAAINAMFRWYQRATRCYVFLSDVPMHGEGQGERYNPTWQAAFKKSRWFTRGWTLQELIAPAHVDFFSSSGDRLGSKSSLEELVCSVTGISKTALRGEALSTFTVAERMSWAGRRKTKLEEDEIYSLFGIFDVSLPPLYGEGRENALRRLLAEIERHHKGTDIMQFSVGIDLSTLPQPVQFIARLKEITEIHKILYGHSTRSTVVLHGLGGIGKTQLGLAYAMRHEEKFSAIFWLNANDENSIRLSFRAIAQQILRYHPSTTLLAGVDLDDLNQVVYAVKAWLDLQRNRCWLMIYDNHDNPQRAGNVESSAVDIRQFLPRSNHGSIIITTRSAVVKEGERLHVEKLLDVQDGLKILATTSGRKDIQNDPGAIALVKELDGLPLALSTAGAYLEHVTTSFKDYLQLYKASWLRLQISSPRLTSYEDRSMYTTWQITFDQIERQNTAAAKLLRLWAYFDKQDIWFDLVRCAHSYTDDKWVQKLTKDELNFNEAVRLLCEYGLVDPDRSLRQSFEPGGYSLHSCVHSWTLFVLNKNWDNSFARLAFTCVASKVPSTNKKNWWLLQRRLLQHVTRQEHFIVKDMAEMNGMEWALFNFGYLYAEQGKLDKAEKLCTRALQGYQSAFGSEHTLTLETINNLGLLHAKQGKLAEAEKLYIQALQGKERALGVDHASTLNTVNNLGVFYFNQGQLAKAKKLYIRALQRYEGTFGPNHTSTLETINNLGGLYFNQGKLAKAEELCVRALQGYERAFGPDHTSTLDAVNNLGNVYASQGKLAEAEKLYIRALQGKELALGVDHTSTLNAVNNLGSLYFSQGQLDKAKKLFIRALQSYEGAFGPDHTSTLGTVNNLGNVYAAQGKLAEAEKIYTRVLRGYKDALGLELLSSYLPALDTMIAFGVLFSHTHRIEMAKKMYTRALSGYITVQGRSSPQCTEIERRLQALQSMSAESEVETTPGMTGALRTKSRL